VPNPDFLVERMTRQGLSRRSPASSSEVATAAAGLQAQDVTAARLGVRARSWTGDDSSVRAAAEAERSVVRTWLMRSTVHLVAAEDVRWMTTLFGPMIERRFANVRWRQLGITPALIDEAIPHAREVLAERALTRHELVSALAERGVHLSGDPQAATHLMVALSARGVTCRGADVRGRESSFVLIQDWAAAGAYPPNPVAELARRYFRSFGPATAADFTTWSGLPSTAAVHAIRDELTEVTYDDGVVGYSLGSSEPVAGLRLLPMFDNYLLAYRDRRAMLEPAHHRRVYVGGIIKATIVDSGRVIAVWRVSQLAKSATIEISPLEALSRRQLGEIERERADLERFLARPTDVTVLD
jgi:hypothetical protein